MTFRSYLKFLQTLITLADTPKNKEKARNVLLAMSELPDNSLVFNLLVKDSVLETLEKFDYLIDHRDEFTYVLADSEYNKQRRLRLGMFVRPNC